MDALFEIDDRDVPRGWVGRQGIKPLLVAHGKAYAALAALQPGSRPRAGGPALKVVAALPSLGEAKKLNGPGRDPVCLGHSSTIS
jgi:hypothetical protein